MARNQALEWMEIAAATMTLGLESAGVIGLRAVKAARGDPKATEEAWRMCLEKFTALVELQASLLLGSLGATPVAAAKETLKHYRRKVAANRRRLSKP
jgi:hypothetical protein